MGGGGESRRATPYEPSRYEGQSASEGSNLATSNSTPLFTCFCALLPTAARSHVHFNFEACLIWDVGVRQWPGSLPARPRPHGWTNQRPRWSPRWSPSPCVPIRSSAVFLHGRRSGESGTPAGLGADKSGEPPCGITGASAPLLLKARALKRPRTSRALLPNVLFQGANMQPSYLSSLISHLSSLVRIGQSRAQLRSRRVHNLSCPCRGPVAPPPPPTSSHILFTRPEMPTVVDPMRRSRAQSQSSGTYDRLPGCFERGSRKDWVGANTTDREKERQPDSTTHSPATACWC